MPTNYSFISTNMGKFGEATSILSLTLKLTLTYTHIQRERERERERERGKGGGIKRWREREKCYVTDLVQYKCEHICENICNHKFEKVSKYV